MPKKVSPLVDLAYRLLECRIPSLSALKAQLSEAEDFADFVTIVRTYLPEREKEILHESTPPEQVAKFASYFEDRYFPLQEYFSSGDVESYGDITRQIPVVIMGFSYEDYHERNWRAGAQLATYLIESPWEDEEENVSMAEACTEHVPKELVERMGKIRLSLDDAREFLKGTEYDALFMWAEQIWQDTGNLFLDTDAETLGYSNLPYWDTPGEVEALAEEWKKAELHDRKTSDFMVWLEEDLICRVESLVIFIERGKGIDGQRQCPLSGQERLPGF